MINVFEFKVKKNFIKNILKFALIKQCEIRTILNETCSPYLECVMCAYIFHSKQTFSGNKNHINHTRKVKKKSFMHSFKLEL